MAIQVDMLLVAPAAAAAVDTPYASISERYYSAIGHAPALPDWALGFWASKERYSSQTEILQVVTEYKAHGIVPQVLVIDWKHYACVGDWDFTLARDTCWPEPAKMVAQIRALGVKQVFVSLHPWSQVGSTTRAEMDSKRLCIKHPDGSAAPWGGWTLPTCSPGKSKQLRAADNCLYDPSNPAARQFLWSKLKSS